MCQRDEPGVLQLQLRTLFPQRHLLPVPQLPPQHAPTAGVLLSGRCGADLRSFLRAFCTVGEGTPHLARIFYEYFSAELEKMHKINGVKLILLVKLAVHFVPRLSDKKCQKIFTLWASLSASDFAL
jgi:hypothetical protein